ncbi:hypothetical protein VLK31_18740 [Variovorax sp. H27-G14]|uniref:M949_RS01915 family surface polysaccharide biosynthesis protein n=1 Tax=Variovorax sp. H27-G14 TaxID=3111914 RepID=UPI0038FC4F24
MKKLNLLALAALAWAATSGHAQTRPASNECPANAPYLSTDALQKAGFGLPVFKRFCFTDKSGSYALVLGEKQDLKFSKAQLSSAIQATLYKVGNDHTLTQQWAIRDFAGKDDAGIKFIPEIIEFPDLDGDGLTEPVLVYRFFEPDGKSFASSSYSGGIKLLTFHQGRKIVIHAITGDLDGDRSTTANSTFFALPKAARQHLVKKMSAMYSADQFGFDNSFGFVPRKEAAAR